MTPRLFSFALCAALVAAAAGVRTASVREASASGDVWGTIVVPGGFAAAHHAASLSAPAEDWRTIPLLIELSYRGLEGLRVTRSLEAHGDLLRSLRTYAGAVSPNGRISLAQASAPGGNFERLLDTLGLELDRDRVRVKAGESARRRIEVLTAAGLPMDTIAEQLNAGESVSVATREAMAPLPLGVAFWEGRFTPVPPPHDLLWAILASREMASLYYGLLGLDGPTLHAIAADTTLELVIVRHARIVPVIGPTLRIENGTVRTPGGPGAADLWQALVGKPSDRPAAFVDALLSRDQGRLAYFYATVAALPDASAAWVMGGTSVDGDGRRKAFQRLYEVFRNALGGWRPDALLPPPILSPADVLNALTFTDRGTLAGPPWSDFWRIALERDTWPANAADELGTIDERQVAGAAEILEAVCTRACGPMRLGAFVQLQREFPAPELGDAPYLLTAARARLRFPALALAIERMKLGDREVYRHAGDLAAKIDRLGSATAAVAMVQFQAAVAMLARMRALGAPAEWIVEHIRSLANLPVNTAGFDGALVRWLDTHLLPSAGGESPADAAVRGLSGSGWQKPGATFEWEGLRYRVDLAATEGERIREVRERFSNNSLSDAISLLRLADSIPEAVATRDLTAFETALTAIAQRLEEIRGVAWTGEPMTFESFDGLPGEVMRQVRRARPTDADRLRRAARILRRAADVVAADAAIALVYATALDDPQGRLAMSRELPRRHRFWKEPSSAQRWTPWSLPFERQTDGAGTHIAGALLGLDADVPGLSVRRMSPRRPAREPNLDRSIADGLWRRAALQAPWAVSDEDLASVDDARARGLAVVGGWDRGVDERLLDVSGVTGPRAGWLRWSAARGTLERDQLTLEDLVRLGNGAQDGALRPTEGRSPSSGVCAGLSPAAAEIRSVIGENGAVALNLSEPWLRVVQEVRSRRAPAALAPGILMIFTTELIDNAVVPFPTDVGAIVDLVRKVPSARFDDYVAAVAARGPLVPMEEVER